MTFAFASRLLLPLAAAMAPAMAADPIRIGVPVGLSGANSVVAPSVVQSAELAVEEINAKGGVLGRPLALDVADDGSGAAGAQKAFDALIFQKKVDVLISMETSAARNAGLPIVARGKTPFIYTSFYEGKSCSPVSVCQCLGARAAGAADRRLFQQGEEGQELLPDRLGLRLRPRHAVLHQGLHREDRRQSGRRGISADGWHRLDADHLQAEGVRRRCAHHLDRRRRSERDAHQAAPRRRRQRCPMAISRSTKAPPRAWAPTPTASLSRPPM